MDLLYGSDQNLCDMNDEMNDLMDNDVFQSPPTMTSDNYMDDEWLNSFFEDPVLNDKMITDAARPPRIASEHSYSSAMNTDTDPESSLGDIGKIEDVESDLLMPNSALDLTKKQIMTGVSIIPKSEPLDLDLDPMQLVSTASPTIMTRTFTVTKQQPTIILATANGQTNLSERSVLPTFTVKQEPPDLYDYLDSTVNADTLVLPPTPPSSNNSDSDSCSSPQQSAPSSPVRQLPYSRHNTMAPYSPSSLCSLSPTDSSSRHYNSLYSSRHDSGIDIVFQQIPTSGVLMLSEEEKRTLISEGYPIPNKLPLTKQEEKNLKKIRRKIKNKISAQESRRKKKEYLEALEKRVESFSHDNIELKKKVDNLENNNRSLLGQLQKLQSLVGKIPRPSGSVPQTGTALMVLVLCFAVFLGSWSPTSLNIGYSSSNLGHPMPVYANPQVLKAAPMMGPSIEGAKVDAYCTPSTKSRVLLSLRGEQDDLNPFQLYGPNVPTDDGHQHQMDTAAGESLEYVPSSHVTEEAAHTKMDVTALEQQPVVAAVSGAVDGKAEVVKVTVDGRFGLTNFSAGLDGKPVSAAQLDAMAKAEGHVESADTI